MKRVYACLLLILLVSFGLPARSYKMIKGIVRDASGRGIEAVNISAVGTRLNFASDSKGAFVAYVPDSVAVFEFSKKGWLRQSREVSGYMIVSMSVDPAAERAALERKAAAVALEAEKARQDSLALEAEKARISQRIKDEVGVAMASHKDTVIIRQTTRTVVVREAPAQTAAPVDRSMFSYRIDFGYTAQIADEDVVYENSGTQRIGNLSPLALEFTFHYNLGRFTSLGIGLGASYALAGVQRPGDSVATRLYGSDFTEKRFDLPVYADALFVFGKSRVRPELSVSGGIYALSVVPLARISAGCRFSFFPKTAPFVELSLGTSPYPYFSEMDMAAGYKAAFAISVKAGIVL